MPKPSTRRSAAEAILSKMSGGAPPPEDDELAPGAEEDAGAGPMPPPPEMSEDAGPAPVSGEDMPAAPEGAPGDMDIEGALAGVEAATQGLPEEAAKEVRTHIEAIKDIVASAGGGGPAEQPEGPMPQATESTLPPETSDSGLEKLPT